MFSPSFLGATAPHWPTSNLVSFFHCSLSVHSFSCRVTISALKLDATGSSKMLVTFYQTVISQRAVIHICTAMRTSDFTYSCLVEGYLKGNIGTIVECVVIISLLFVISACYVILLILFLESIRL
jgi:hypothetical protein